jgi:hypothetical protein
MATATSNRRPPTARRAKVLAGIAALAAIAAVVITVVTVTRPGRPPRPGFPHLTAAAAPASWPQLTLPNHTAVLSYPPTLRPIPGDHDAVSVARRSPAGSIRLYLNATPRQGSETLAHWAAFRLRLLRADDAASARPIAASQNVRFRGGRGSCVIDAYTTRIGAHHYQEIACLVQGHTSASVIIAAAPASVWPHARPLLFRAVSAYIVR